MTDPHVSINLTFRTPASRMAVLHVVAAIQAVPYELTGVNVHVFDMDEVDGEGD